MTKTINTSLTIRLSEDERKQLEDNANGMSLSAYIRLCTLGEKAIKRKVRNKAPIKDHAVLSQLFGLLGRTKLANNINQMAKAAHSGKLVVTPEVKLSLLNATADIAQMKRLLLSALGYGD